MRVATTDTLHREGGQTTEAVSQHLRERAQCGGVCGELTPGVKKLSMVRCKLLHVVAQRPQAHQHECLDHEASGCHCLLQSQAVQRNVLEHRRSVLRVGEEIAQTQLLRSARVPLQEEGSYRQAVFVVR